MGEASRGREKEAETYRYAERERERVEGDRGGRNTDIYRERKLNSLRYI